MNVKVGDRVRCESMVGNRPAHLVSNFWGALAVTGTVVAVDTLSSCIRVDLDAEQNVPATFRPRRYFWENEVTVL